MSDENPPSESPAPETKPDLSATLAALVKQVFFVADSVGEPQLSQAGAHTVVMLYPDESVVRVSFEQRPGRFGATGTLPLDEADKKKRNEDFESAKKADDERKAALPQPQPV